MKIMMQGDHFTSLSGASFEKIKDEVFAASGTHPIMTGKDIEFIQKKANESPLKKCRILMHGFPPNAKLHVMLVVLNNNSYTPPHIHREPEYNFIIEGKLGVIFFNDDGSLTKSTTIGTRESGLPCLLRFDPGFFHFSIALTPSVTFLEIQLGPHAQTQFASWAPSAQDVSSEEYTRRLRENAGF